MKTDSQIQSDVMQELNWDPQVTHQYIGVSVKKGVVTLSGNVPTFAEKYAAEKAAQRVSGVKAVVENIEVKVPSHLIRDDQDIAEAIVNQFKWNVQVPDDELKVSVENGWVTLHGVVDWAFQRNAAETSISKLTGVKGVTNNITIREKFVSKSTVKQKIEEALQREAVQDAQKINVEVSGSRVILSGNVKSFSEKEDANWAAWSAPGVTAVDNKISVVSAMN